MEIIGTANLIIALTAAVFIVMFIGLFSHRIIKMSTPESTGFEDLAGTASSHTSAVPVIEYDYSKPSADQSQNV